MSNQEDKPQREEQKEQLEQQKPSETNNDEESEFNPEEIEESNQLSKQLQEQLQSGDAFVIDENDTLDTIKEKLQQQAKTSSKTNKNNNNNSKSEDKNNNNNENDEEDEEDELDVSSYQLEVHTDSVYSIALFEDPQKKDVVLGASGSGDDTASLFDPITGKVLHHLKGHKDTVISVAFNSSGSLLATASYDSTIKIWNTTDGSLKATLEEAEDGIEFLVWHPKGNVLLAGGNDFNSRLWSLIPEVPSVMQTFYGHSLPVTCGIFSVDGKNIVTGSEDGFVKMWSAKSSSAIQSLDAHAKGEVVGVTSLAVHPQDPTLIISTGADSLAKVINLNTSKVIQTYKHEDSVECAAFFKSPQVHLVATGSLDSHVFIWDYSTKHLRSRIQHKGGVIKVVWHPTEPILFSCSMDGRVLVIDGRTGQIMETLTGHNDAVLDIKLCQNGSRVVSGSDDKRILIFEKKK